MPVRWSIGAGGCAHNLTLTPPPGTLLSSPAMVIAGLMTIAAQCRRSGTPRRLACRSISYVDQSCELTLVRQDDPEWASKHRRLAVGTLKRFVQVNAAGTRVAIRIKGLPPVRSWWPVPTGPGVPLGNAAPTRPEDLMSPNLSRNLRSQPAHPLVSAAAAAAVGDVAPILPATAAWLATGPAAGEVPCFAWPATCAASPPASRRTRGPPMQPVETPGPRTRIALVLLDVTVAAVALVFLASAAASIFA